MSRPLLASLVLSVLICGAALGASPDLETSFQFVAKYAAIAGTASPNISVVNISGRTEDVTITYAMPQGTTFIAYSVARGNATCTTPAVGSIGDVTCHATIGASGQVQFAVAEGINGNLAPGTTLTHAVTVTGTNASGPLQPASASASTVAQTAPTAALTFDYPASALSGAAFTYHVTITNTGTAGGPVSLLQTVAEPQTIWWPDSFTQTSGPAFTCSLEFNDICSASSFPPGAVATFAITLHTHPRQTDPISVRHALIFSDFAYAPAGDTHAMTFTQAADTSVTINGAAAARIGDDLAYVVTVRDGGPSAAGGTATITIPPGLAFASYATGVYPPQCVTPAVGASGTLTCTTSMKLFPDVPHYDESGLTLGMTVHVKATTAGTFPITATFANSDASDPNSANNTASTNVLVTESGQADLAVTLHADRTNAVVNTATVTYDAAVTNNGPSTASNVRLTLITPSNTTMTLTPAGCTGQPLVCTVNSIPAGQTTHRTFSLRMAQTGDNVTTVSATSDALDTNASNNSASVTVTARVVTADLRLSVSPRAAANPGDEITYQFSVTNNGPDAVPGATVTMALPAGSTLLSSRPTCIQNGSSITCSIGNLAPSASATLSLSAAAPASPAPFVVPFSVSSSTPDPDMTNNTVTVTTAIAGAAHPGEADVAVSLTSEASVPQRGPAHYVVTAVNHGPATATNVTVRFQLSGTGVGATAVWPSDPNVHCFEFMGEGLDCVVPSLAPGAAFTFSEVTEGQPLEGFATGTARVATGNNDPNVSNNTATAVSLFGGPDLGISVTPSDATVTYGASATHTITVSNSGSALDAVAVTEAWSGGFAFATVTPSSGSCTIWGKGFTCNVGALAAGAHATVTVTGNAAALGVWSGSVQAYVPQSGTYPVGASYALSVVAPAHHRAAGH